MSWRVKFLNNTVEGMLEELPVDMQAGFLRISELIQADGLERVREPYVKHLEGPLWEMHLKGQEWHCPCDLLNGYR
jgi:hypothetical protein